MKTFRDLDAWQRAVDLVEQVYLLTERFPSHQQFSLTQQMQKSSVSVPSNIAEGQGRFSLAEWKQFLGHARGSLYEIECQAIIAERLGYIDSEQSIHVMALIGEVGRLLSGLIRYVDGRIPRRRRVGATRRTASG